MADDKEALPEAGDARVWLDLESEPILSDWIGGSL